MDGDYVSGWNCLDDTLMGSEYYRVGKGESHP